MVSFSEDGSNVQGSNITNPKKRSCGLVKDDFLPEESFQSWSNYGKALLETKTRLKDRVLARSSDQLELHDMLARSQNEMKKTLDWFDLIWFGIGAVMGAGRDGPRTQFDQVHLRKIIRNAEHNFLGPGAFTKNRAFVQKLTLRRKISWVSRDPPGPTLGPSLVRSLVHAAPSVTKLKIGSISGLISEVWRGVILDLKAIEELEVTSCDELRYLWESKEAEASSKVLVNLSKLEVSYCEKLVSLGEKGEEYNYGSNVLTSLSSLKVWRCENFKHLSCPNNIETLEINWCDSITCVSFFSMGGGQKLKSVRIRRCKKLMIKEELGEGGKKNTLLINSKSMPLLESVWINNHPNVASIIDFGGNFIHLTSLGIWNCQSTEDSLFADLQLQSLTSLTDLYIKNCPSMDVPTAGLWPPNLRVLWIGRLKKPISEWGPQKFPSTLVDLVLIGEAATNWSELSHLHLPSSLTRLRIDSFMNLERVSEGLQHLTSLQHLKIWNCPKLKDLPEKLLPSLLSLDIWVSPDLKERCSRGGSYWPKISHIPRIET